MSDCPCHPSIPRSLSRRQVIVGGAAATGAIALTGLPSGAATGPEATPPTLLGLAPPEPLHDEDPARGGTPRGFDDTLGESPDRQIMFPVLGLPNSAQTWIDTYNACRGSGCSRRHQGQDLMGPRMTKLLACVSGTVVEMRHGPQPGGNSLYIRGDDGWFYCYLHINNDTPGVSPVNNNQNRPEHTWGPRLRAYASTPSAARGVRVNRGEHIAYMGDSGNAENVASHLHFEIRKPATGSYASETQRLWASASVNPRVSLQNAEPARERASVPPETFVPWDNATAFVDRQYRDLLGRAPSSGDTTYWTGQLNSGDWSPPKLLEYFLTSAECTTQVHAVTRLYRAYFLRNPDRSGFDYWVGRRRGGAALIRISDHFAVSPEFTNRYGNLTDEQFVDRIYQNVLGREPDAPGKAFWVGKLAQGSSRGWVMVQFSESDENKAATLAATLVIGSFGCMLRRMPSADDIAFWRQRTVGNMLDGIRRSPEYANVAT